MSKARLVLRAANRSSLPIIDAVVARERPAEPLVCLRPITIAAASRGFVAAFPGDVLYAVKCNPEPRVLRAVWAGGVRHFDCASLPEIALVRKLLPQAEVHFMHPVKARHAIHAAFHEHGVIAFAFDSAEELEKIVQETVPVGLVGAAPTLGLFVRLAVTQGGAYDLSGKFGVNVAEAAALLRAARPHAARLGIAFHVGSQCLDPAVYAQAMELAAEAVAQAEVAVDIVDVGGGFPSVYPGMEPPALETYFSVIHAGFEALPISYSAELWCEPGRALCAEYASLIVRVEKRRGSELYINDGAYGALFDAAHVGWRYPVRLLREAPSTTRPAEFSFFGPTCDDIDQMAGPFELPADIGTGDYIEIGMLGAYGTAMRTQFNGFGVTDTALVEDEPMATLYAAAPERKRSNVVKL
jgi:ornithine decarboxylase